jgi:hypothetical protein
MEAAAHLVEMLAELIGRGVERPTSDGEFNELAFAVFAFQFENNEVYRAWCEQRRQTPETVEHWKQIPVVPTSAFKDFPLTCFPVEQAVAEFHTSGTTQAKSGKHYFGTLELYDAAIIPNFAAHLLPDGTRLPMLVLTPSPEEAPHSSLSHMMGVVTERGQGTGNGGQGDQFFVKGGQLETERLERELRRWEEHRDPVVFLGTALAFVHFFEHCRRSNLRFALPADSRVMETGGFKGKAREVPRNELYGAFAEYLGIPPSHIVNEYGMTELSTQFYDETMRVGRPSDEKTVPPWARVVIINPQTGSEAATGETGLIRVFDLANISSVAAIQTEDFGVMHEERFNVLGRATAAEARGCSIAADEMLSRAANDNH